MPHGDEFGDATALGESLVQPADALARQVEARRVQGGDTDLEIPEYSNFLRRFFPEITFL